jgi:hypothetical protein
MATPTKAATTSSPITIEVVIIEISPYSMYELDKLFPCLSTGRKTGC